MVPSDREPRLPASSSRTLGKASANRSGGDSRSPRRSGFYPLFGKRLLDLALVVAALPLWVPLLAVLVLLTLAKMGRPALFVQARPGRNALPLRLVKLRTMSQERESDGTLAADASRLTAFGRRMRASSLDELPELWNVIRGEMSLVGPRPLLMEYVPLYSAQQQRRHEVRPGITGWAQVSGRNAISWEEKFERDVWYVDHLSLGLDIRILLRTVRNVLLREGITREGHATMPPFLGS